MKTSFHWPLCGLFLSVLVVQMSLAQGYKATITGKVSDAAGQAVPGCRLIVTSLATNATVTTTSDESGNYVVAQLSPGRYSLRAEAKDFKAFTRPELQLEVNQTLRADVSLEVGLLTDEVIVRQAAQPINTENSSLGEVISTREILDIPLNGRNYLSLAQLAPGVAPAAAGANPFNINGARPDHVNYLLDGVSNTNRRGNEPVVSPSIDAIQEFKVLTSNFSAEYGRLGGGIISVALKSGGNEFHGTLFEFLRNDALDARGFFDPEVPKLRRNQFGGVLGGPVVNDQTFFFVSYEGLRNREEQTRLARVPTVQERAGVFTTALRNPFTNQPFQNNAIPPTLISPVALRVLNLLPSPNRAAALNFTNTASLANDSDNVIAKVDHKLSRDDLISSRFLANLTNAENPFRSTVISGFGAIRNSKRYQASLSHTRTFSPSIINEARFGFTRHFFAERTVNAGKHTSADIGLMGVAAGFGLANFAVTGLPEVGDATFLPDEWTDNEFSFSDTLTVLRGAHDFRIGGEFQRSQHFNLFASFAGGQLAFQGNFTGNPVADFLLGLPTQTQRQVGTNKSYLFSNYVGIFAQDDWKLRPNLTLNLGIRYDLNRPPVEKYNRWANFIPSLGRQVRAGEAGYPRSLLKTDKSNFAPRVGFAYRPFGDAKTVVRGGYGIFYGTDLQFTLYQLLGASAFPFTRLEIFQAASVGSLTLADPFPTSRPGLTPGASSPNGWDYENPSPYTQEWNLTIGREITPDIGVEVSYVGSKGTNQSVTLNLNQTRRTPQSNVVPFPGFGRILFQSLGADSTYHALQVSVEKRFRSGLAFRSSFTFSKSMDTASFGSSARLPQDPLNLRAERGLSEFDRRRVWSNDFVYELPFGRGRRLGGNMDRVVDAFIGGWQLNGIIHFYDGRPFTPVVARANAQAGFATRPDRLRSGELAQPSVERWFDPTAFAVVPAGAFRFGNSGRNILTGPGSVVADASFFKSFALPREGHRLQFRAEFFNLPNRANFGQPVAGIDLPTAGAISTAGTGRQIQFALKYSF